MSGQTRDVYLPDAPMPGAHKKAGRTNTVRPARYFLSGRIPDAASGGKSAPDCPLSKIEAQGQERADNRYDTDVQRP